MVWLRRGRCQKERQMVSTLLDEGHDITEIASAALKLVRAEEKQRPIAPISELRNEKPKRTRANAKSFRKGKSKKPFGGRSSHEQGMVRLSLSSGSADGLNVSHVVGSLAHHADIPGACIGKIKIEDKTTFVDVPEDVVNQILAVKSAYRIGRRRIQIECA